MEQGLARWAHNPKVGGSNPPPAIFFGGIAQLVEQRNHNPLVVGSNPAAAICSSLQQIQKTLFMIDRKFVSTFELFSIGVGPSSSHTVGPMRAANQWAYQLPFDQVKRIKVDLYGSLALTGKGHGTDKAILLGLEGNLPEDVDPDEVEPRLEKIRNSASICIIGSHTVPFNESNDLIFHMDKLLPYHANGMRFTAFSEDGKKLLEKLFYSVGGGFIVNHDEIDQAEKPEGMTCSCPYSFTSGEELLLLCEKENQSIAEIMYANEYHLRSKKEVDQGLDQIWEAMQSCVKRGCKTEGILPGGLEVKRRAPSMYQELIKEKKEGLSDPATPMDWMSLWALAVNEENAAGSRVVTAPTNGAAGIIPAVLHYYLEYVDGANQQGVRDFLLTSAAIAILFKKGASLSAAEMGCQGEVGVACSMAAAGLAYLMGGTPLQVENAAEIGMEHNLGLTCDPVAGLVQIPCIERNTMGAIKAVNAARLALRGDGTHHVALDHVIETMRQIGVDMHHKYKETSKGGLAVNVIEC